MKLFFATAIAFLLVATTASANIIVTDVTPVMCPAHTVGRFTTIDTKTLPSGVTLTGNGSNKVRVVNKSTEDLYFDSAHAQDDAAEQKTFKKNVKITGGKYYRLDAKTKEWVLQEDTHFYIELPVGIMSGVGIESTDKRLETVEMGTRRAEFRGRRVDIAGEVTYFAQKNTCRPSDPVGLPIAAFMRDLTIGSRGDDVVKLQSLLEAGAFLVFPAGVSKGYFGPATQAALIKYQISKGIIPASGYFGPKTRAVVGVVTGATQ